MSEYALIKISDSTLQRVQEWTGAPPDVPSIKDLKWIPTDRPAKPVIDAATERLELNNGVVGTDYVFGWTVVPLTQQEQIDHQQSLDIAYVQSSNDKVAEILTILIDALLLKSVIVPGDFNAGTRQKYLDLKDRVDRLL